MKKWFLTAVSAAALALGVSAMQPTDAPLAESCCCCPDCGGCCPDCC